MYFTCTEVLDEKNVKIKPPPKKEEAESAEKKNLLGINMT